MAVAALPELPAPFRWDGAHVAADLPGAPSLFTTRRGGVSAGPFASLNLGRLTDDDPARVDENRDRARRRGRRRRGSASSTAARSTARASAAPPSRRAPPARTRRRGRAGDRARATPPRSSSPPTACRSRSPPTARWPRCTAAGAGWPPGSSRRACARCARSAATGPVTAALGPGARGCCYEVGEEVHAAFAGVRRPPRRAQPRPRGRRAAQLAAAGVDAVHDTGLCTMCGDPACSSATAATAASPAARRGSCGGPERARRRAASARTSRAIARRTVAATRPRRAPRRGQVRRARGARRARRGGHRRWWARTAPRSSRPRRRAYPGVFRWHFIGQLQSRKVKQILPHVELIHSVAVGLRAAPARAPRHAGHRVLVEVNVAGEEGKAGVAPRRARRLPRPLPGPRRRPDDDAAVRRGPRGQPPALRRPPRAGARARPAPALDGHLAGLSRSRSRRGPRSCASARACTRRLHCEQGNRPDANPSHRHGLPRHLAPHARLLRPGRGPRRPTTTTRARRLARARGRARGPLPRAARTSAACPRAAGATRSTTSSPTTRRRAAHDRAALRRRRPRRPRRQRPRGRPRAPRDPEVLQRRPGRRGQVQGLDPGDHQPPGRPTPTSPSA